MTLQTQLNIVKADFESKAPPAAVKIMHDSTEELRRSGILNGTIKIGDKLPEFTLNNQDGASVSSSELLASGPLVISFFRGIWCPYCNAELEALEASLADFESAGARFVAISPQTERQSAKLRRDKSLNFDILSDANNALARALGVSFELSEDLKAIYQQFGVDLTMYNADESWALPMPTRLIIGQDGTVLNTAIDPDYTVRPDPSVTLSALTSLTQVAA